MQITTPVVWMLAAGLVLLAIGLAAARKDLARARGIDKIVALSYTCYAIPLAVFGAEHLTGLIPVSMIPRYMPWRVFWIYFVGVALIAAALSIATKIHIEWSGFAVGILMFLFVAMLHLPGAIRVGGRIPWTVVVRELSFGGAGWVLAGAAMGGRRGKWLIAVGQALIGITALAFGVAHFFYPLALPGVPLEKEMAAWIPARAIIDYVTGALLVAGGICFVLGRETRRAAAYLGAWIVLMVVVIYGPVLIGALGDPRLGAQVEGVNYFADTLLFGGTILTVASATQEGQR